jgi:hypothetical protein
MASAPAPQPSDPPRPEVLQRSQGEDHTVTHMHRLSMRRYPPDCPPLKVRWFYAVDSPKRKPSIIGQKKADQKPSGLGGSLGCGAGVALLGVLHGVSVPKNDFCSAPAMGRSARRKAVALNILSFWTPFGRVSTFRFSLSQYSPFIPSALSPFIELQ